MSAQRIDGKAIAAAIRAEIKERAAEFNARTGIRACLAAVLVGEDPASSVYVRNKGKACIEAGMLSRQIDLPATTSEKELLDLVGRLNADDAVHGILVQLPLPDQIDESKVIEAIAPGKDVDGFHPVNAGRLFIGKPGAILLLSRHATVTICHSRTQDLPGVVRSADVVIAAVGKAEMIRGSWIRPGAVVIDVGINRLPDGRLVGDVAFEEASAVAGKITPVPGGVGPMTITMLLHNTLEAAALRAAAE